MHGLGVGSHGFLEYAYGVSGRRSEAEPLAVQRKDFPAAVSLIRAGLGDKDSAFAALERMAAEKDPRFGSYLTYPEFASLRSDPRMNALRQEFNRAR
jgi:hypothetical protein